MHGRKHLVFYLILLANSLFAQERNIIGSVRSASGEALTYASVNLVDERSTIIKFAITNGQGEYSLAIPANAQLWLEVSYIGYKKQRKAVLPNQPAYHFILAPSPDSLSEVIIKKQPVISTIGDTLRYYVTSFASKEDRSIRDVLQRMPGIEVDGEGTIYYNGKKIENLYIQGDDLMDGRYGTATRSIRKEMILSVDVIRNHQPIRVLQDKVISDKTSVNLVLKYENSLKLSANAMAGAGLPKQYDASFTPMLLNKNIKMISTIAFNNSSVDYRGELKQLGSMISNIGGDPAELSLSLGTIGPPDLPVSNYYFNRSGIINLNNIFTTRRGLQLKANIQGFTDRNNLNYYSRVENYLGTDTIAYNEKQSFYNKPLLLNASFNMMVNKPRYFFNNNTRIKLSSETDNSFMDFNSYSFGQSVERIINGFSNDLSWMPSFRGKGIGELRWLISYSRNRQVLDIGQGYYTEIKEHEGYHDNVLQRLNMPAFFSNGWFAYKIPGERILQEYKLGYIHESQTLGSALSFVDGLQETPYKGDAGNNLEWKRQNVYFSAEYQIRKNKFRSIVQLPLAYQRIHHFSSRLIFNPYVYMRYDINNEQFLTARYRFSNSFGNITGVYRGAVLLNYRSLQANDAGVQEKTVHSSGIGYEFQKSISMLFVNAGISHDRIRAQNILATEIADNIQKSIYLPYENTQLNTAVNAGFSKYFFGLKSTISVKSQLSRFRYVQFINTELLPFYSDGLSVNGSWIKKLFGSANITYQPSGWWMVTKLQQPKNNSLTHRMFRFDQRFSLGCNVKRFFIETTARHSYSRQSNNNDVQYFFMDAGIRYSKKSMDMNLALTNLFNVKDYTLYTVSANRLVTDQYVLRGRMAVLRVSYYF